MHLVQIEHVLAVAGGVVVFVVASIALRNDWKTPGLDNQVFKLMLGLLALGGVLAALTGLGVIGKA
ncbi:MAG TPA: hypothetical protein VMV82_05380 [Candidatus Dormibacteraeota bacterium]|nr:hypothetical protein [Candidatus Dormibacteraeota bacterium]